MADNSQPASPPEMILQQQQEHARLAREQHSRDVGEIVSIGQQHYGRAQFDESSRAVVDAFGDQNKAQAFMSIASQFDRPHDVIVALSNDPGRLKKLAGMSPARQAVEIGRIEAQMASFGHVETGSQPMWRNPEVKSGRVSDEDWSRNYGEGLSDKQWNREFDRRMAEKHRR